MKLTRVFPALGFVASTISTPLRFSNSYDLEGYGKDNPVGATTGGADGETITVDNVEDLRNALEGDEPRVVYVSGAFNLTSHLKISSNKSLIGLGAGASFNNSGIAVQDVTNVILRNLKISYVYDNDDITISNSTRVWVDHNEFFSDINHGPDLYDGQVDIVRASDWITVSWNYFHDHWKSSLVGSSDSLRAVDQGRLHVTYHHNHWRNTGTRGPAGRFGHQHVYSNYYEDYRYQAIHSRSDNQVLVEGNVFFASSNNNNSSSSNNTGAAEALSTYGLVIPQDSPNTCTCGDEELDGFANLGADNDWGADSVNITRTGNFTEAPYAYTLTPLGEVRSVVLAGAGVGKIVVP
ncbi:pectin lyase fold/virulence factor [Biscogniauxia marginata]|nr:pectin lyase fold/virulence factor [Biscogniauxia marginata]